MKIIIAEHSGFCFGVKKAVDLAYTTLNTNPSKDIAVIGQLIHNPQILEDLYKKGAKTTNNSLDNLFEDDIAIIRAHGVPDSVYDLAKEKNITIVDATCPYVKRSKIFAKKTAEEGYLVIIVGKPDHPEVLAIKSSAGDSSIILSSPDDVAINIDRIKSASKISIISQTTQTAGNFNAVLSNLISLVPEVRIFNTICGATSERQSSARDLAEKADIMIIVGGKNSSNTTKLYEICKDIAESYHIESEQEIKREWFNKKNIVGITAGASTPNFVIDRVKNTINCFD